MNIPINFDKIEYSKFNIDDNEFYIELDHLEKGDVWVMHDGAKWPLCFDIDWQKETYALIKCAPGDGRNGKVLATDAPLMTYLMRDADSFINHFLKDTVSILLDGNLI